MKKIIIISFLLWFSAKISFAQYINYYYTGGSGTTWIREVDTSPFDTILGNGGPGSAPTNSTPGSNDRVYFSINYGATNTTIGDTPEESPVAVAGFYILNGNWIVSPTFGPIEMNGDMMIENSSVNWNSNNSIIFRGGALPVPASGYKINLNGVNNYPNQLAGYVEFNSLSYQYKLLSNISTTTDIAIVTGDFLTNNFNISCRAFYSNVNTGFRNLNMGNSTIDVKSLFQLNLTSLTSDFSNCTININGNSDGSLCTFQTLPLSLSETFKKINFKYTPSLGYYTGMIAGNNQVDKVSFNVDGFIRDSLNTDSLILSPGMTYQFSNPSNSYAPHYQINNFISASGSCSAGSIVLKAVNLDINNPYLGTIVDSVLLNIPNSVVINNAAIGGIYFSNPVVATNSLDLGYTHNITITNSPLNLTYTNLGSGLWGDSSNWGGCLPKIVDNVTITPNQSVNINLPHNVCRNFSSLSNTIITGSGTNGTNLDIYGNFTLNNTTTYSYQGNLNYLSSTAATVNSGNVVISSLNITFNHPTGNWTLQNNFTQQTTPNHYLRLQSGILNVNNYIATIGNFISSTSDWYLETVIPFNHYSKRELILPNNSMVEVGGNWAVNSHKYYVTSSPNSTIHMNNGNLPTFDHYRPNTLIDNRFFQYGILEFTSNGANAQIKADYNSVNDKIEIKFSKVKFNGNGEINGQFSYKILQFSQGKSYIINGNLNNSNPYITTQIIEDKIEILPGGCPDDLTIIKSSNASYVGRFLLDHGIVSVLDKCYIQDIKCLDNTEIPTITGTYFLPECDTATVINLQNYFIAGTVTGFSLASPVSSRNLWWQGGNNLWSSNNWYNPSLGSFGYNQCPPTPADNVFIENNLPDGLSTTVPVGNILISNPPIATCRNITANSSNGTVLIDDPAILNRLDIYGEFNWINGANWNFNDEVDFVSQPGTYNIHMEDSFKNIVRIKANSSYNLTNDLVLTDGDIYHDLGSLHTNNFNLSILAGSYVSSNFALYTNPRRLDLGSSTITCQGFNILTDNYILDPNTSTINLSYGINYSLYSIATGVAHMPLHNINFMPIGITNYINAYYESPSIRVHPTFNSVKFNGNGSMYGQLNIDSVFFSYGSSYSITTSISPVVFWSDTINTINSIGNCGNSISIFSGNSLAADIIKIDSTVQNPVELFNFVIQNIHISSSGVSPFYAFQSSDLGGNQNWVVYSSGLGFPTSNILNNDTSLCESLGTILFSVDSIYPWSINNYWSLPAGASTNDSLSNAAINILNNPFNGNLIFTSDFGCGTFTHDTIYVEIDAQPDLAIAGADQSYCLTDSAISVILNANNPTIGIGEWSGTPNTIFSDSSLYNTTASNLSEGENVLVWTVTNGACPPSIDSIIITIDTIITNVNAYIMDSSQLCSQHIITLQADSSIGTWTTIAGEGEITSANSIITNVNNLSIGLNSFLWTVATPFGICPAAADTVSMFYGSDNCLELFIPDGFSPNDDNNHDTWIIYGLPPNTDMSVEIYNRWGNLIYKNEHYDNSWNGNSNSGLTVGNEKAPEGTFYYILNIENYPDTFVGYITLWR